MKSTLVSKVVAVAVLLSGLSVFAWHSVDQVRYADGPYNEDNLANITASGTAWDLYFGRVVDCDGSPCHVMPDYPADNFLRKTGVPHREFPLRGYERGQHVFQRGKVVITKDIVAARASAPVLHSIYVWAESYDVYVDGEHVQEGALGPLNVPLRSDWLVEGRELTVAVHSRPGELPYQGLANLSSVIVVPSAVARQLEFLPVKIKTADAAWRFIPHLFASVLLMAVFLFAPHRQFIMFAGLYLFLAFLSNFIASDYAARLLPSLSVVYSRGRELVIASMVAALIAFVGAYFESRRAWMWIRAIVIAVILAGVLAVLPVPWGVSLSAIAFYRIALIAMVLSAVIIAWRQLQRKDAGEEGLTNIEAGLGLLLFGPMLLLELYDFTEYFCQDFLNSTCLPTGITASFKANTIAIGMFVIVALRLRAAETKAHDLLHQQIVESERRDAIKNSIFVIAHDLKRPFSKLSVITKLLDATDPQVVTKLLQQGRQDIEDSLAQGQDLIEDLRMIGSPNQIQLKIEDNSTKDLVETALATCRDHRYYTSATIDININTSDQLKCDRHKTVRILENLLENALDAMESGAGAQKRPDHVLTVSAKRLERDGRRCVTFSVKNSGSYIPPERQQRIFEPFYTEGKTHGTGLGLAIVKCLAEAQGGQVTLHSVPDFGTEFSVEFPG